MTVVASIWDVIWNFGDYLWLGVVVVCGFAIVLYYLVAGLLRLLGGPGNDKAPPLE